MASKNLPNTKYKVRLILYDRGKILLLKQRRGNGGNYTLVGGTVEQHEFARESLIRETLEESNITIEPKDLSLVPKELLRINPLHELQGYLSALLAEQKQWVLYYVAVCMKTL